MNRFEIYIVNYMLHIQLNLFNYNVVYLLERGKEVNVDGYL